jgi:hypothetical protein
MPTRKRAVPPSPIVETTIELPAGNPIPEPKLEPEKILVPIIEKPAFLPIEQPEIINSFYDAIGISYCKKCGEPKRTNNDGRVFCPASKVNCLGLLT